MKGYKFSLVEKTLVMTKAFEEAVVSGEGEEYKLYTRLMKEHPGITVIRKTHKSPTKYKNKKGEEFNCNQFKNLKYENMKQFIEALPKHEALLEEYTFVRKYASRIQTNGYTLVRRWFMAQFPEFRTNPVSYFYNTPEVIDATDIFKEAEQKEEQEEGVA